MRAKDVVGRKIVKVNQTRFWDHTQQKFQYNLDSLWLDDGTSILFMGDDDGIENFVRAFTHKREERS